MDVRTPGTVWWTPKYHGLIFTALSLSPSGSRGVTEHWLFAVISAFQSARGIKSERWTHSLLLGNFPEVYLIGQSLVTWLHLAAKESKKLTLYLRQPCDQLKLKVELLKKYKG